MSEEVKATITYTDKRDAVRALKVDSYLEFITSLKSALRNSIKYQLTEGDKEFHNFVKNELFPFFRKDQLQCGKTDLEGNPMYGEFQKIIEDIYISDSVDKCKITKARQALVKNTVWFVFEYMRDLVSERYRELTGEEIENIWND